MKLETPVAEAPPARGAPVPAGFRRLASSVALALLVAGASGCEVFWDRQPERAKEWSVDSGWDSPTGGVASPTASALRAEAKKAFDAGAFADALVGLKEIEEEYPHTQEAREAYTSFLIGECYFNLGQYEFAHDYYQKTLARRPAETVLLQTLNRIYNIGLAFLHGIARRSFFGIKYRSPAHGVSILIGEKGLVTRYHWLDYSDDALWEVADYYYKKKEYPEAERILERLVRDYPGSEWHEGAEYQLALAVFKQVKGADYDQRPLKKAKRAFNLYRNHYPRGSKIEQVNERLREIAEMEARHDLKVAKYYMRESRPQAAMYYLRSVLIDYPRTDAYREAQEIYHQMERFRDDAENGVDDADEAELEAGGK